MDHVACFGSEEKLIDCSYDTDTSEDDHSADIRVHCAQNSETPTADATRQESTNFTSVASLTLLLIVCVLLVIIAIVYIVYRHLKYKKLSLSTER